MSSTDPITLEIIQNSLQAAADEMFAAMRKTAMSSIIYEVLDMGTGVTDRYGEMASSGAGIPTFVGVLDKTVKRLIRKFNQPGIGSLIRDRQGGKAMGPGSRHQPDRRFSAMPAMPPGQAIQGRHAVDT